MPYQYYVMALQLSDAAQLATGGQILFSAFVMMHLPFRKSRVAVNVLPQQSIYHETTATRRDELYRYAVT